VVVTTEPVTARAVRRTVTAVGSLYGRDEVALTPKVEGRVAKIYHDVGDVVWPGDVLLELDPVDYRLAVAELRRALELELTKLGLQELPTGPFSVTGLPSVVRAAALERMALNKRERERRLGGVASAEEREQMETDYAVARANYRQAVMDAEATLASARARMASLETALQRLSDTKVVAPGDRAAPGGKPVEYVVAQRSVSEGEIVRTFFASDSTTLFRLVIDRPLKLRATIPERHKGEVKVGQEAELEVEAYPGEKFAGTVSRVNPAVDRASRTFQVEVLVPNDDRRLSPGSFAKVAIQTKVDPAARTVPEEALVRFAGVTKVFVVEGSKAREVPVRAGVSLDLSAGGSARTWVEVEGELKAGASAVTSGQSQLVDGGDVRVR
jgi:RND family efflux transporter MFP subunit